MSKQIKLNLSMQSVKSMANVGALSMGCLLIALGCMALLIAPATARADSMGGLVNEASEQQSGRLSATLAVVENPEVTVRVLENLLRSILYSVSADLQTTR